MEDAAIKWLGRDLNVPPMSLDEALIQLAQLSHAPALSEIIVHVAAVEALAAHMRLQHERVSRIDLTLDLTLAVTPLGRQSTWYTRLSILVTDRAFYFQEPSCNNLWYQCLLVAGHSQLKVAVVNRLPYECNNTTPQARLIAVDWRTLPPARAIPLPFPFNHPPFSFILVLEAHWSPCTTARPRVAAL